MFVFALGLPAGPADKLSVISGKSFSSKATAEPKVASPAVSRGQFKYSAGARRFIGNGETRLSGCYCADLTQNY